MRDVVRIHASSGTTGKPTTVGYTRNDVAMWAEVCARALACAGTTEDDIVQVAYGYGLFTGGLGAHYAAELIGAAVIPISGSNTQRQLMLMQDFGTTVLCCTPSFALYVWDVAQQLHLDVTKLPLRVGVSEPNLGRKACAAISNESGISRRVISTVSPRSLVQAYRASALRPSQDCI